MHLLHRLRRSRQCRAAAAGHRGCSWRRTAAHHRMVSSGKHHCSFLREPPLVCGPCGHESSQLPMTQTVDGQIFECQHPSGRRVELHVACACTGVDAGTPIAARVLAESAAAESAQRAGGFGASPGAATPAHMASPAIAGTPRAGLVRTAQARCCWSGFCLDNFSCCPCSLLRTCWRTLLGFL